MASLDKKAFLLRVDPDLWVQVERLAASELRSVNGEVEHLLRAAVAARTADDAPRGRLEPVAARPRTVKIAKSTAKTAATTRASQRTRR